MKIEREDRMYDMDEVGLLDNIRLHLINIDEKLEKQKQTKLDVDLIKIRLMNQLLKELKILSKIRSEVKVPNAKEVKIMTKIKDEESKSIKEFIFRTKNDLI